MNNDNGIVEEVGRNNEHLDEVMATTTTTIEPTTKTFIKTMTSRRTQELLKPILQDAITEDDVLTGLDHLANHQLRGGGGGGDDDDDNNKKLSDLEQSEVAVQLMLELVVMKTTTTTTSPLQKALDGVLDACRPEALLAAISQVLVEVANTPEHNFHPDMLQNALRALRRLLLLIQITDGKGAKESSLSSSSWIERLLWRLSDDNNVKTKVDVVMDGFLSLASVMPLQIANACHQQKAVLPKWATRSNFNSKWIESSLMAAIVILSTQQQQRQQQETKTTTKPSLLITCLQMLFRKVSLHGTGSSDIAVGIYRCYHHNNKKNGSMLLKEDTSVDERKNNTTTTFGQLLKQATVKLSIREKSKLLYSMIQQSQIRTTTKTSSSLPHNDDNVSWTYLSLCGTPILATGRGKWDVQDAFVDVTILSSNQSGSRAFARRMVVRLLQRCDEIPANDDDDDDSCSTDNDDNITTTTTTTTTTTSLGRQLSRVGSQWSQMRFIQKMDEGLQNHVCNFVLLVLHAMMERSSKKLDTSHPVALLLLEGVSKRLDSSIPSIRLDGMRVGEALGRHFGQELHFSELDHERKTLEQDDMSSNVASAKERQQQAQTIHSKNKKKTTRTNKKKKHHKSLDPHADYVSDEEEEEDSSECSNDDDYYSSDDDGSTWSDELIPHNVEEDDEEDLREIPKPHYLEDCLHLLSVPQDEERASSQVQAALEEIETLVRSTPADLPDLAVPLTRRLLLLVEDSFNIENFVKFKQGGLKALAVMEPNVVGDFLTTYLFDGDHGLSTRVEILHTLEVAAHELSGALHFKESLLKNDEKKKPQRQQQHDLVTNRFSPRTNDESKTRRWRRSGGDRRHRDMVSVSNKFGPIAPRWFYSLIAGFVKNKEDTRLWGGANGKRLLTTLLLTLAALVESAGLLSSDVLANDLIQFSWSFRTAEEAEIRGAVLTTIGTCLPLLRYDTMVMLLQGDGSDSLPDYLRRSSRDDPSATCRNLAVAIATEVSKAMKENMLTAL